VGLADISVENDRGLLSWIGGVGGDLVDLTEDKVFGDGGAG